MLKRGGESRKIILNFAKLYIIKLNIPYLDEHILLNTRYAITKINKSIISLKPTDFLQQTCPYAETESSKQMPEDFAAFNDANFVPLIDIKAG